MTLTNEQIAERLEIHPSVVDNFEEEWQAQNEDFPGSDFVGETFIEFMCRTFAESAFLMRAIECKGTAVECLESYDDAYSLTEEILRHE